MTGPWLPQKPDSTLRFEVHEYICDQGARIVQAHAMGTRTIRTVMHQRPDGCIYVILHLPECPDAGVIVADLSECVLADDGWMALGRHWLFPSIEAARAATVMRYGTL